MALHRDKLRPTADSPNHPDNQPLWTPKGEDLDIILMGSTEPPPGREILPGMEAGTVGNLLGAGASFKSTWRLQMAIQLSLIPSVQAHWAWSVLDPRKEQLRVMYASIEDPPRQVHVRMRHMLRNLDQTELHRLAGHLRVRDFRKEPPNVLEGRWLDQFHGYMVDRDLLIIDTWRRAHAGDENDSGDMAQALQGLETLAAETGCAVLFIHHMSKAAILNGSSDLAQAGRGSSVLTDNPRWTANMVGMTEDEANRLGETSGQVIGEALRKEYRRWVMTKSNYGPMQEQWFRREPNGLLRRVDLVESGRAAQAKRRNSGNATPKQNAPTAGLPHVPSF